MRSQTIIPFLFILTLTSCEAFVCYRGKVFDKTSYQPIDQTNVYLIFKRKDTMHFVYSDTLGNTFKPSGSNERLRYSNHQLTDTSGFFSAPPYTMIVPQAGTYPSWRLVFVKEGFKTLTLRRKELYLYMQKNSMTTCSLQIFLERDSASLHPPTQTISANRFY
jgi:hypothetical protein